MVKSIVYDQEAVMNIMGGTNIDRSILVVVSLDIQSQIVVNPLCIYRSEYSSASFVKQSQDSLVNIIVNKNDAFVGTTDEVAYKNVSVEYLSVEKNALAWRQRCFKEEVNLA